VEQLLTAKDDGPDLHHAEAGVDAAGDEAQPVRLRQLPRGQHVTQALALGLVMTGDEDAVAGRRRVQLVAYPADVAAEALDRLDAQVTGRLDRRPRQRRQRDAREAQHLLEDALHRKQTNGIGDALQVVLARLVEVVRLGQDNPASGGEVVGQVAALGRRGMRSMPYRAHQLRGISIAEAALGLRRELTDRLDFVAEELQAVGGFGVGRVHVKDATAPAEFAR